MLAISILATQRKNTHKKYCFWSHYHQKEVRSLVKHSVFSLLTA